MIRTLHRDGMLLELAAGGDRPAAPPLNFPDAIVARRLLDATARDPAGQRIVRELLSAAGEDAVAMLEESAALDRLAIALVVGRVRAALARPRHATDNVAQAPSPEALAAAAPPPAPAAPAAPAAPVAPQAEPCANNSLVVKCGHGARKYKFTLPPPQGKEAPESFQVLAGVTKGDVITVETKVTQGPCASHRDRVLSVGNATPKSYSDTSLTFEALCDRRYAVDWDGRPLDLLWPHPATKKSYPVGATSCQQRGVLNTVVEAYPDIKWEASLKAGFSHKVEVEAEEEKGTASRTTSDGLTVTGSIELSTNGHKYKLSTERSQTLKNTLKVVNASAAMIEKVSNGFQKLGGASLQFDWPCVELTGGWGWEEAGDKPEVGFGYEIGLGFSPLIGITGTVDVLAAACSAMPTFGQFINWIREKASDHVELKLEVSVGGKIDGKGKVKKELGVPGVHAEGFVSGTITLTFKGEASAHGGFSVGMFGVSIGASFEVGAELGAKSEVTGKLSFKGDEEKGPYVQGSVDWSGVELSWAVYASADATFTHGTKAGKSSRDTTDDQGRKHSAEHSVTWIEPRPLWEGQPHYFLNSGGGAH